MPAISPDRVKQTELAPRLNGPASRGRPLRILFVHSDVVQVRRCVRELSLAHFNVSADVVPTSEKFAQRLRSKFYDIIVAEYPAPNSQGAQALELLHRMEKRMSLSSL